MVSRRSLFPQCIPLYNANITPPPARRFRLAWLMYEGVPMTVPRDKNEPRKLPMMPIRDMVIFPYMMTPFVVGRESSVRALEEALTGDRKIFLATQHDASTDEPKAKDIYQVGRSAISCRA